MRYGTLIIGIVFTATAGVMGLVTALEPALAVSDMVSPKRITYLFLGLLGLFGLLLIVSGLAEAKGAAGASGDRVNSMRLGLFMGMCVLYLGGLSLVGCFPAWTCALLFASMRLLRVNLLRSACIALVFSLTVFVLFKYILGVPLP